ncbi:MAG: DUF2459 domain-containing protein [Pseudomonadota bacterium]
MQASASGPAIHVCAGAVHTDFAVPIELARSERFGELADVIPETLPSDAYALMGWGDYRFFTEVPYASDLRPGVALGALLGRHQTALRIMFVREAGLPELCLELPLDAAGQGAIAQHILETVGEPEILSDSSDRMLYLKSNRRYGVFQTCNDWTSDALRQAGLPTARWIAPFAFSVTWPLRGLSG